MNWYWVVGGTDLPQGIPCLGSGLAGMAILPVCVPHDCCRPYSYCTYSFWSASYSCSAYDFCYICDSCYLPCCASCSYYTPYPVPVAYLHHPWSLSIPIHGLRALHFGHVPRWGCLQGQAVEGSWPVCAIPHQAGRTAAFRNAGCAGGPSP